MGNVIWDNSDGDNDGNVAANYTPARVPTGGDVADFDSATTSDNCTFSGNISCDGMLFATAYAGIVDAATHDIALGANGLDCTGGGSATLDLGSGTWTITGGTFDSRDLGTLTWATAEVVLSGTCGLDLKTNQQLYDLTVAAGGTTTNISQQSFVGNLLKIEAGATLTLNNQAGHVFGINGTCENYGTIDGDRILTMQRSAAGEGITVNSGAGISAPLWIFQCDPASVFAAGTYGLIRVRSSGNNPHGTTFLAGTFTIATLELRAYDLGDLTVDLATNGPTVTITGNWVVDADTATGDIIIVASSNAITLQGDLVDELTGGASFTAGGQPITATGASNRNWDGCGGTWGATIVNMSAGTLTLTGAWTCSSFAGTDGDLDLSGETLTASGAVSFASGFTLVDPAGSTISCDTFTADGQAGLNASATWTLSATTSAAISNATIANCDASGGVGVDATDNCTDGDGNTNVNFGGGIVNQLMGANVGVDLFDGALIAL